MQNLSFLPRISALSFTLLLFSHSAIGALKKVSSPGELQSALDSASPGDTIQLAPAVFMGEFIASRDGTEGNPITVTGDTNSTIISEGTAFTIRGNYWKLKSLKIMQPAVGVLVDGTGNSLESLVFQTLGKGIQVRGPGNTIKSCVISDAEGGIYLESDGNKLHYNSINIQAPSIIVGENTCCGLLDGNVANGRVDLKGSGYNLTNNVCNHGMYVTGCDNSFSGNVANGASFPKGCASHDLGGNSYRGLGPNDSDPPQPGQQQYNNNGQYPNNAGSGYPNNAGSGYPNNAGSGYPNNAGSGYPNNAGSGNPNNFNNNYQGQGGFVPQQTSPGRQTFPAQVTGGGTAGGGRAPQCTCTCV